MFPLYRRITSLLRRDLPISLVSHKAPCLDLLFLFLDLDVPFSRNLGLSIPHRFFFGDSLRRFAAEEHLRLQEQRPRLAAVLGRGEGERPARRGAGREREDTRYFMEVARTGEKVVGRLAVGAVRRRRAALFTSRDASVAPCDASAAPCPTARIRSGGDCASVCAGPWKEEKI